MTPARSLFSSALLMALSPALLAQTTVPGPPPTVPRSGPTIGQPSTVGRQGGRGRGEPCWEQSGVSSMAIQRHRQIEQSTRAEVQSVCSNPSINQQEKYARVRELHERARRETESLMSPQQRQYVASCRSQRGGHQGGGRGMRGAGGGDPCGGSLLGRGGQSRRPGQISGQIPGQTPGPNGQSTGRFPNTPLQPDADDDQLPEE